MQTRIQHNPKADLSEMLRYLRVHRYLDTARHHAIKNALTTGALRSAVTLIFDHCVESEFTLPEAFWAQLARTAAHVTGDNDYFQRRLAEMRDEPDGR